jgi:hypothetical protein
MLNKIFDAICFVALPIVIFIIINSAFDLRQREIITDELIRLQKLRIEQLEQQLTKGK